MNTAAIPYLFIVSLCCSFYPTRGFYLFEELDIQITRANTTYMKSPTRPPDLFVMIFITARDHEGNGVGPEVIYVKTWAVKKTQEPEFDQTFGYVRDDVTDYTVGTDNVFRVKLYDQGVGYEPNVYMGSFEIDLMQLVREYGEDEVTEEKFGYIKNDTLKAEATVGYTLRYKIDHHPDHHHGYSQGVTTECPEEERDDDFEAEPINPMFHVHHDHHDPKWLTYTYPPDYDA